MALVATEGVVLMAVMTAARGQAELVAVVFASQFVCGVVLAVGVLTTEHAWLAGTAVSLGLLLTVNGEVVYKLLPPPAAISAGLVGCVLFILMGPRDASDAA